jgi:hypothetical protein
MAKQSYIPRPDNDYSAWHDTFKAGVVARQGTFGLAAPDVTVITNDNLDIHTKITNLGLATVAAKQATADKDNSRSGTELRARALIRRIKAHPNYTVALGEQLGIVGPDDTTDLTTSKPTLSGTDQTGGTVELSFSKSVSDGVNLYSKRGNETGFTFLARDTSSPYVDNRPLLVAGQPELRRYKCVYVSADAEIGQFSDEVPVTCAP